MGWTHYIYGLSDERDGIIRYIGVTTNLERRLRQHHIKSKQPVVTEWINSLPSEAHVTILDVVQPHEDPYRLERFHIDAHFMAGFPLFNRPTKNWERTMKFLQESSRNGPGI